LAAIVRVQNLSHAYGAYGATKAVRDLSFQVEEGTALGLVGPRGAGKSTVLRILATLLRPTAGEVWIGEHDIRRDMRGVRRIMGYVPDSFGVYDRMTAGDYLDFFAACYDIPKRKRTDLIMALLQQVNLSNQLNEPVKRLTQEARQRLGLARALIHAPDVLILDEPISGLGAQGRAEIGDLLRSLRAAGKTIVLSSPTLLEVREICDQIGVLSAGRVAAWGTPAEIEAAARRRHETRHIRVRLAGPMEQAVSTLSSMPNVRRVTSADQGIAASPVMGKNGAPRSEDKASPSQPGSRATEILVAFVGNDLEQTEILTRLLQAGLPVIGYQEVKPPAEDVLMQIARGIAL
jgi:ABC-2 type transport system ATP-binding protein